MKKFYLFISQLGLYFSYSAYNKRILPTFPASSLDFDFPIKNALDLFS